MEQKVFRLNEVIFTDNVYQNWMYSICEGSVDIYSGYGTPDEKKLITLTKGQFFGEIGMIAMMPRTATAVAAEENVVLEQITHADFEDYLKNHPENLQPIMSSVSKRIRELTADLSMAAQMANETLTEREQGNTAIVLLTDFIKRLLGKLTKKKNQRNDYEVMRKHQQALASETPSLVRFAAGDVLFRAGDQANCMYDIYDGSVGIYSDFQTENAKQLAKLHTDDVFGEMGILDDMPRSASAVCLTDCTLLVIKPENFMAFFQQKPVKVLQILMQMCMQLRDLTQNYLQVCSTLEEMNALEEKDIQEDVVMEKLENIRQNQI